MANSVRNRRRPNLSELSINKKDINGDLNGGGGGSAHELTPPDSLVIRGYWPLANCEARPARSSLFSISIQHNDAWSWCASFSVSGAKIITPFGFVGGAAVTISLFIFNSLPSLFLSLSLSLSLPISLSPSSLCDEELGAPIGRARIRRAESSVASVPSPKDPTVAVLHTHLITSI